jgi:hypothetical protein
MVRKSLVAGLGFLGVLLAGTAGGSAPAAAGYACGPWNNWCAPRCGHWNNWCRPQCGPWNGWCSSWRYPGFSFHFGSGPRYRGGYGGGHYAYKQGPKGNWNGNHNGGGGHYDRDDYDRR